MATVRESFLTSTTKDLNDGLIAGERYRTEIAVTIAASQPVLLRGQILIGPATGATPYVDDVTSGAENIIGILGVDTIATGVGQTTPAFMYVDGEFNEDKLIGLDAAARTAMQAMKIFAKRVN